MKHTVFYSLLVALLLVACRQPAPVDPLKRARADGLNKEAFVNRYRQPDSCLAYSQAALRFIDDSLPDYVDGQLRAYNNMAFAYYQKSDRENAQLMLDRLDKTLGLRKEGMRNGDIEWVIHDLIQARLLQRDCRIADSYRLLYDIGRQRLLERNRDNLLYNYAQSEYYITMLVLNYHYRNEQEADVCTLVEEVERNRSRLKVDFAQDMALNYALAYGWQSAGESTLALDYCDENFRLLGLGEAVFCPFHYANTLQMTAWALRSQPGGVPPDSILALYDEAREEFFDYGDPYQMLGGTTSTARYALLIGDTAKAHQVLAQWRSLRGTWQPFAAPKMELGYFDLLLRSRIADNADQARTWYEHYAELQDHIRQSEQEDFVLQQTLANATRRSRWMTHTAQVVSLLLLVLLVLTLLLWRNASKLRREKRELEASRRRDVERIANVETCLSVMRHDVSPFIGYLRSPNLSPELRSEVLEQLLRTFDNIKNWTRLSIPSGLVFNASSFALQEVFDEVRTQVVCPSAGVELRFLPTGRMLWADRLLVVILLRNLVTNALQHTAQGSVTIGAAEADGQMVDITVADTGCGMTPEQCESLFRADRPLPADADHGFGLILCRYIIKKHDDLTRRGCKLWVESTPGHGTVMHVRLASPNDP
ncbi:MAG: DUF5112 domain-containing protein [Bacteroidales bacterium]|nr:DUF5112 domain-containing protein [Bacteroidales bacterium]